MMSSGQSSTVSCELLSTRREPMTNSGWREAVRVMALHPWTWGTSTGRSGVGGRGGGGEGGRGEG